MTLDALPLKTLEAVLDQLQFEQKREGVRLYRPYPKQLAFHAAGKDYRELCFAAGNQVGKSYAAAAELAIHLTGEYPDWWPGRRWDRPIHAWAAGVTGESTRDTIQRLLMGRPGQLGTGTIPADCIVSSTAGRGVADTFDTVVIKNKFGGTSTLGFKSYAIGREKWQGETLDLVAFDEEPPEDIYTEGLTRTNATGGRVWLTFTPLLGMSSVVHRFFEDASPDRHLVQATIDDAEHYTPEQRNRIIAGYPAHEREARARGIPTMGSGRVFPIAEESITCEPFPIPKHWPRLGGIDFGISHPSAVAFVAHDRDTDCIYLYDTFCVKDTSVILQAPLIAAKGRYPGGAAIPICYPHDGDNREKGSGETLANQYRNLGVNMMHERVTHEGGGNSLEAGIMDMLSRFQSGRLKIFNTQHEFLSEFRQYHRKNGIINPIRDDVISALRYACMGIRYATPEPRSNIGKANSVNFGVRKGGY